MPRSSAFRYAAIVMFGVLATALAFVGGASAAEEPVATVVELKGAGVLVNDGQRLQSAALNMPLFPGFLLETPEGGGATVRYENGCEITMEERQRLEIAEDEDCKKLAALLTTVGGAGALGAAVAAGGGLAAAAGGTGAVFVAGTLATVGVVGAAAGSSGGGVPPVSAQ